MVTPELIQATMQERMRASAELQLQKKARALQGQGATPRGGLSRPRFRGLPLPSFVARRFRTASVS